MRGHFHYKEGMGCGGGGWKEVNNFLCDYSTMKISSLCLYPVSYMNSETMMPRFISQSRRTDLFRPSWPKALTHGFLFLGHLDARKPITDSPEHQNFVGNGFLTFI